jgi:ribonuclease E
MTDPVADDRGRSTDAPAPEPTGPKDDASRDGGAAATRGDGDEARGDGGANRRRRGSRGGRNRSRGAPGGSGDAPDRTGDDDVDRRPDELPDRMIEGRPKSTEAAERALVPKKPRIGDSIPPEALAAKGADGPEVADPSVRGERPGTSGGSSGRGRRRRGGRGGGGGDGATADRHSGGDESGRDQSGAGESGGNGQARRSGGDRSGSKRSGQQSGGQRSGGQGDGRQGAGRQAGGRQGSGGKRGRRNPPPPVEAMTGGVAPELDDEELEARRGRERKGRPVGRYLMCVSVREHATHIAVLEGRNLIEHYVSRPSDDISQIHGNVYLGRVQNVLPGMEAAFVDIATPKNAVLYRGDVQYEAEDIEEKGEPRIEQLLKARQSILCQVTKNPIAHKGARLTTEVSLPGRFVVMIPNSTTVGISKRLADEERKRLRKILDRLRPEGHGLIVRTAAEGVTAEEIEADVTRLVQQWGRIEELARTTEAPALLYREPDMAVRVIREEFNKDYRGVVIDGRELFDEVQDYVSVISPGLAERVQYYDREAEALPLFERHHVHEQLHKALDRKVWLPSGGSLIIEHTEALTVIDVNTGKNVGSSSLEETVFRNNLEAAEQIARQLRLRDIGGIIVVDFVDMEIRDNREQVIRAFRDALARDKTRTQVFDISELGLVEMTRKRIGEGLIESYSRPCPDCEGRGIVLDEPLIDAT